MLVSNTWAKMRRLAQSNSESAMDTAKQLVFFDGKEIAIKTAGPWTGNFLRSIETMSHITSLMIRMALIPDSIPHRGNTARLARLIILPAALLALLGVACAAAETPAPVPTPTAAPVPKMNVLTTTTVLADLVRNVGGELTSVTSIVPPGVDAHSFQTTPSHSLAVGEAKLIVSNGLGLDDFLAPVLVSAQQPDVIHIVTTDGLNPEPLEEMHLEEMHLSEEDHGQEDEGPLVGLHEVFHEVEEGAISAEAALGEIEALLGGHEQHPEEDEGEEEELIHQEQQGAEGHVDDYIDETLKASLMELVHEVEEGHLTPEGALEEMESLLEQAGRKEQDEHGPAQEDEPGHGHSAGDPHFWQDPIQTIRYVVRIRDGLIQADPANAPAYTANAEAYILQLRELDQEIAQILEAVPPERRHLVTFHDAFGYFGRRYGWQVSAFVPGDASDVTPAAVVQVMERVKTEGIPAVFAEPQFGGDVLKQVATDTGVRVGIIYSDTIDDEVTSYIDMMRFNAQSLAENLR
jgi:ABC-type Zn uptake system ZnuABC Zn-binding protein ZnuA